jgi:DNA ligase-1
MNTDNMQHGMTYAGQDVAGWIASEKYDGIRAYWDGETLWTRGGKAVPIPQEWRDALPAGIHLDGELFSGYGQRKKAEWLARAGKYADECRFMVFDAPMSPGCYADRIESAWRYQCALIQPVTTAEMDDISEAAQTVRQVQFMGGEGIILRHPELAYTPGRTDRLLKLKTWELN